MSKQGQGLTDKLYWRPINGYGGQWHCFRKSLMGGTSRYVSLCGRWRRGRSGGQSCHRPEVGMRCGECDGREMDRRGWTESGPASKRPTE